MKNFLLKISAIFLMIASVSPVIVHANADLEAALAIGRQKEFPAIEYNSPKIFHDILAKIFGENFSEILKRGEGDIFAKNTEALGGVWADGWLKWSGIPCAGGQVAVGLKSDGSIRCGSKNPILLVRATVRSGEVKMSDANNKNTKIIREGQMMELSEEIILETGKTIPNDDTGVEIVFEDKSLIRLAADTKIKLKPVTRKKNSTTDEVKTIASVAYENGLLWGRVLSEDGPEFRYKDIVAGVRGTNLFFTKAEMRVLQSQDDKIAARIFNEKTGEEIETIGECTSVKITKGQIAKQQTNFQNSKYYWRGLEHCLETPDTLENNQKVDPEIRRTAPSSRLWKYVASDARYMQKIEWEEIQAEYNITYPKYIQIIKEKNSNRIFARYGVRTPDIYIKEDVDFIVQKEEVNGQKIFRLSVKNLKNHRPIGYFWNAFGFSKEQYNGRASGYEYIQDLTENPWENVQMIATMTGMCEAYADVTEEWWEKMLTCQKLDNPKNTEKLLIRVQDWDEALNIKMFPLWEWAK